ncbi:hypothetical protein D3C73_1262570 [compost metagenome]
MPPVRQTCRKKSPVVHRMAIGGVGNVVGRQRATVNLQDHLAGCRDQASLHLLDPALVKGVFTGDQPCYGNWTLHLSVSCCANVAGSTRVMAANEERVRKLQGRRARRQSPGKTAETAESGPGDFHRRSDLPGFCSDLAKKWLGRSDHPGSGTGSRRCGWHAVRLFPEQGGAAVRLHTASTGCPVTAHG